MKTLSLTHQRRKHFGTVAQVAHIIKVVDTCDGENKRKRPSEWAQHEQGKRKESILTFCHVEQEKPTIKTFQQTRFQQFQQSTRVILGRSQQRGQESWVAGI
jgi:hypothetical protein